MAKRTTAARAHELVRDEAVLIPIGDTTYQIDLDHQTVEELSQGICSEILARRMFLLLRWLRDSRRQIARERAPLLQAEMLNDIAS